MHSVPVAGKLHCACKIPIFVYRAIPRSKRYTALCTVRTQRTSAAEYSAMSRHWSAGKLHCMGTTTNNIIM